MKISQIVESTTSGSVATVASPLGATQTRNPSVYPNAKMGTLLKGKPKKGKYQNSISEDAKKLANKLAGKIQKNVDKSNREKEETKKRIEQHKQDQEKKDKVEEAKLDEEDLIIIPGQGMKRRTGFVPHGKSRVDHEVEMARSDLFQAAKNAKAVYGLISTRSEDEGLEGWVQEKIIKAADYLNTVREYLEGKELAEMTGGVLAGGVAFESEEPVNEKFASKQQAKLMYATAGGADTGVSKKVAKEFIKKSHGQKVSKLPSKVKKD